MLIISKHKEGFIGIEGIRFSLSVSKFLLSSAKFLLEGQEVFSRGGGNKKRGPLGLLHDLLLCHVPWMFELKTLQNSLSEKEIGSEQPLWRGDGTYSFNLLKIIWLIVIHHGAFSPL